MLHPLMCVISAGCCQLPLFTVVVWGYFICIFFTGIMLTGVKARCLLWCDSHLGITLSRSNTHDMVNPHNIWNPQLECCCQNSKQHLIIMIVVCSFLCHFSFRPQGSFHETRWKCDWSIAKKKKKLLHCDMPLGHTHTHSLSLSFSLSLSLKISRTAGKDRF